MQNIYDKMKTANKMFVILWIPAHVEVHGNEEADETAAIGTRKALEYETKRYGDGIKANAKNKI
jgi:ribonuclease HI